MKKSNGLILVAALVVLFAATLSASAQHPDNTDPVLWNMLNNSVQPDWEWAEYLQMDVLGDSVYVVGYSATEDSSILAKYRLTGTNTLEVVWTNDPLNVAEAEATDIVVRNIDGDILAFMTDYDYGLQVYDVTGDDSTAIAQVGFEGVDSESNIHITIDDGSYVYLTNEGDDPGAVIDISDPEHPDLVTYNTETNGLPTGNYRDIAWLDDILLLGNEDGLLVLDVSTVATDIDTFFVFTGAGTINGIHFIEYNNVPMAFVATGDDDANDAILYGVNLSTPGGPALNMNFPISVADSLTDVYVSIDRTYIYVTGSYSGGGAILRVVDITSGITGQNPGRIAGYCEDNVFMNTLVLVGDDDTTEVAVVGFLGDDLQTFALDEDNYFTDVELDTLGTSKWNWSSTFVYPKLNPVLPPDSVFESIMEDMNVFRDQWGNEDLQFVHFNKAYELYMDAGADWAYSGWQIHPRTRYEMWDSSPGEYDAPNFMGYPLQDSIDVSTALSDYTNDISIVYEESGGVWVPGSLNTLGDLEPGEMYKVWTTDTLSVVIDNGMMRATPQPVRQIAEIEGAPTPTGDPFLVLVTLDEELMAQNPYAIDIYDGDLLVGRGGVQAGFPMTPVTAWGGDETHELQGFTKGHTLRLVVRDEAENAIFTFTGGENHRLGIGVNGYIQVSFSAEGELLGGNGGEFTIGEGYPQPFNPMLTVPFSIARAGNVGMKVFDILGREVYSRNAFFSAGRHQVFFDADKGMNLSSGLYVIRLEYNGVHLVQKAMLLK